MFRNIDGKIKVLASACAIIGCLASVIGAIVCWATLNDFGVWLGFVILICGCLVFLLSSFLLYGFGELITQTTRAADEIQELRKCSAKQMQNSQTKTAQENFVAAKSANSNPIFQIVNGKLKKYTGVAGSAKIPDGVTSIEPLAFNGCFTLTSVTIPDSVTSIGNGAFSSCFALTSITIPEGVTTIEESAFLHCKGLTAITIPASITSIGSHAFEGCNSMETVFFAEPSGWERDGVPIDEKMLSDPKSAAEYIKKIANSSIARNYFRESGT